MTGSVDPMPASFTPRLEPTADVVADRIYRSIHEMNTYSSSGSVSVRNIMKNPATSRVMRMTSGIVLLLSPTYLYPSPGIIESCRQSVLLRGSSGSQ